LYQREQNVEVTRIERHKLAISAQAAIIDLDAKFIELKEMPVFSVHVSFQKISEFYRTLPMPVFSLVDIEILDLPQMRRKKKTTVTTVEVTWETGSRLLVKRQQTVVRSGWQSDQGGAVAGEPSVPGLLDVAAKFLRGEDEEK
jgi:hypothetical protein